MALALTACSTAPTDPSTGPGTWSSESEQAGPQKQGTVYLKLGVAYLRQDKPREAVQALRKAVTSDAEDARIHNALALAYQQLGALDKARRGFERALQLDPEDPQIHNNYGVFLIHQGEYTQAASQFRQALASPLYATPETAYYNLGWLAQRQGNRQEAVASYQTVLRLRPEFHRARLALARLLLEAGQEQRARDHIQRLLEAEPEGKIAQEARALLEERGEPQDPNRE